MYRATAITQRDGSTFANSNCRMAGAAVGIDFHTLGGIRSSGADMRSRQDDQSGGTDSGDCAQAWDTYGQTLTIRDGQTFDDAIADLESGRALQLDVWHATTGGPCLSGSGAYGHDLAVAPERNGDRWLVNDPWCSPPKWEWWPEAKLRAGAEKLGSQCFTAATGGPRGSGASGELLAALMRRALHSIVTRWTPDRPAIAGDEPRDTGGAGGRILYSCTRAQGASSGSEGTDVAINAVDGLASEWHAAIEAGVPFYSDPNLAHRLGQMSSDARVAYIGQPIGETVDGGARAILVNTGSAYSDGSTRPTIVYVAAGVIVPERDA